MPSTALGGPTKLKMKNLNINWSFLKKIAGVILIILGLLALVTPLTPGAWLIFVGAEMLGIGLLSRDRLKQYYKNVTGRYWDPADKEKAERVPKENTEEKSGS